MDISTIGEWVYTLSLLTGAAIGLILRQSIECGRQRANVYDALGQAAIGVFLPLHVFMTIIRQKALADISYFTSLFLLGAFCCFSILACAQLLSLVPRFRRFYPHYKYIASTFAGGGRGVVILSALMPFLGGVLDPRLLTQGTALDALAIFDVGYWLFFTLGVYNLMGLSLAGSKSTTKKGTKFGWENIGIVLATGAGVATQFFDANIAGWLGRPTIEAVGWSLASVIVVLSAAAITLRAKPFARRGSTLAGIMFILFARVLGLGIPLILLFKSPVLSLASLPMLLFLIAPPSSWIDRMLHFKGATDDQVTEAATINLVWNVMMYLLVGSAIVLNLSLHFSDWVFW